MLTAKGNSTSSRSLDARAIAMYALGLVMYGCSADLPLATVPGRWNPCYNPCLASSFDRPVVMNEAYYRLAYRSDMLAYWRLCQGVIDWAVGADHVVIVEQLPEEHPSQYWYVLILVDAEGATAFTGGTGPLRRVCLGENGRKRIYASGPGEEAVRYRIEDGRAEKFLEVVQQCGVYEEVSQVYALPKGETHIGRAPVMIHVFRRSDGRAVEFLLADPVVTPSSICKDFELRALKDPSLAWFGAPRHVLLDRGELNREDREHQLVREQLFRRSLPARCILNGALMLLRGSTKYSN